MIDPPVPPRDVGNVPVVIAEASTWTPVELTVSPVPLANVSVGFPETPSPLVTEIPFEPVTVLVVPVPVPVRTTIPFVEIL